MIKVPRLKSSILNRQAKNGQCIPGISTQVQHVYSSASQCLKISNQEVQFGTKEKISPGLSVQKLRSRIRFGDLTQKIIKWRSLVICQRQGMLDLLNFVSTRSRIDPSAMLSMRELDRNASGRGKPQLMIDGGQRANKKVYFL